ncbi:MAG: hypothetical protein WA971_11865 [Microbacterium sp.]
MTSVLLAGGTLMAPDVRGAHEVLSVGGTIAAHRPPGDRAAGSVLPDLHEEDVSGLTVLPGLIDGHLHVLGGGGGQGLHSRIPELPADAVLEAGITTCVGMPGVDTVSRPPAALLAKTRSFSALGVRAFAMAGGFRWPAPTITDSLFEDLYQIPDLIGLKLAIDERLATVPTPDELARLLTELFWLRGATGKACLLHAHLGTRIPASGLLAAALDLSGAPPTWSRSRTPTIPRTPCARPPGSAAAASSST